MFEGFCSSSNVWGFLFGSSSKLKKKFCSSLEKNLVRPNSDLHLQQIALELELAREKFPEINSYKQS